MKKVVCHDIYDKTYEVDADKLIYRPSVYGLLIEDNKILLLKQHSGYDFTGGGADLNETVQEVFDISGFSSILGVFPNASEALNGF